MRISTKIISAAAAAALIAGGALAAAPAQAAAEKVSGDTVITVPLALIQAAGAAGVAISAIEPAEANATMDSVGVVFPVVGPPMDGMVMHTGGLSLASSVTKITLTWEDPTIEYATGGPGAGTTAQIKGEIGGIPAGSGFEQLNGSRAAVFDVSNMKIVDKKGKIVKDGKKGFKRTWTQTITGDVTVVNSPQVVMILNGLLVGPGKTLFTAGQPFGELDTTWSVTRTCKTKKACA